MAGKLTKTTNAGYEIGVIGQRCVAWSLDPAPPAPPAPPGSAPPGPLPPPNVNVEPPVCPRLKTVHWTETLGDGSTVNMAGHRTVDSQIGGWDSRCPFNPAWRVS